ncbi:MAG: helix-turn-helix domain-containing protein [Alphaproteobacteria bacterium]|nr:helix-turn-helix domain-containing protein [Alphaproteobacteria bacterium]
MTLADIAKAVGMSRSGLAVRFKELVGDTPMNYLTNWRMLRAKEFLKSGDLPLMAVAEQVGYTSEAAFSRAFKREHNQSPSAFRRSVKHSRESA